MSLTKKAIAIVCVVALLLAVAIALQLRKPAVPFRAAFNAEFLTRPDGYPGLTKRYQLQFPAPPKQMDSGLMYKALADGAVDVIDGFSTDGRIPAYDLYVLEDDKKFFPPYYAAPLVRADTLKKHPEIKSVLERLAGRITQEKMQQMNFTVDEKGTTARKVAQNFLRREKLLEADAVKGAADAGTVNVGSKEFTEQEILGEIMSLMLEYHTDLKVVRRLSLGGTMICFVALQSGDLDLYADYTGTGLVNILKKDVINDPDEAYKTVKTAFADQYQLTWLAPLGFNNTYTLTMRSAHAEKLGIRSISDLAQYLQQLPTGEGRSQ